MVAKPGPDRERVGLTSNPALDIALASLVVAAGFVVAVLASNRAVTNATELAAGTRIPRFVIGFTLLALGTDLPEIANSIVASLTDHGDLNVGDSIGSAATQVTLVLGLLPIIVGTGFAVSRARLSRFGATTIAALLFGLALMADGFLSRIDAVVLLAAWALGSSIVWGRSPEGTQLDLPLEASNKARKAVVVLLALVVVAGAALAAVWGMTVLAEALSIPEFIIAFFLASIGTSLPELFVTIGAVRSGQSELAIGDIVGSSFLDSTLSLAAGPLIAPVAVTASLAMRGALVAAGAVLVAVVVLMIRQRHDWKSGALLVLTYGAFYLWAGII
ncbi:MAG: sodium:calcium antiporter [Actinobacteria bacterium]|nr:MAG: sodium:calcium antiporter [Actinomycetota bacterium]